MNDDASGGTAGAAYVFERAGGGWPAGEVLLADDEVTAGNGDVLAEPVDLPEILDLLIVGGGPSGTAAAFRAKELGLAALVIDYDDLMKRIRD